MNRLKDLRIEKDKLQEDIGKIIGVSGRAIGNYETGKRELSPEKILKLAEYFEVSTDYLLGKTDIKNAVVNVARIPILGTVKAGYDWLAEENVVDYITLKENIPNKEEYYALRITRSINVATFK